MNTEETKATETARGDRPAVRLSAALLDGLVDALQQMQGENGLITLHVKGGAISHITTSRTLALRRRQEGGARAKER